MSERLDRIERILEENSKGLQELRVSQAKTDEKLDKLATSQAKTDEQLNRTDEQLNRTDEQLNRTDEQLNRLTERVDTLSKNVDKLVGRTDHLDNFTNNYGQAIEEFFFRSLNEVKKLGNIQFNDVKRDIKGTITDNQYDILMLNGHCVGLIEVKNKVHVNEVLLIKDKIVDNFKKNFPQYKSFKYYFALASMVTYPDLIEVCKEEGVFLLTQKGDHIELVNDKVKIF